MGSVLRTAISCVLLMTAVPAFSVASGDITACSEKLYQHLPGSGTEVREKALDLCQSGDSAEKIIACSEMVYQWLPGSGTEVKDKALRLCRYGADAGRLIGCTEKLY